MAADPDGGRSLALFPNSLALIAAKVSTLTLGFLFWVVAAQFFSPADVGLAAGVVAAMMLCTQIALMGVGSAVIALLPAQREQPWALLDSAFSLVVVLALTTAWTFLLLASGMFAELGVVADSRGYALLFVGAVVMGTVGILLDQVSTSLRRGDQALVRGAAFGVTAVGALLVLAELAPDWGSMALLAPWVVAGTLAFAIGVAQLRRSFDGYLPRPCATAAQARQLLAEGVPNYALTLAERAPGLVLPIVVTELLSPETNAAWYAAWMMAWVVFIVPIQVGMTLFAEIAHDPGELDASTRRAVRAALVVGVPAAGVVAALAHPLLALLGPEYADAGVTPLRILVLGLLPLTVVQVYYASCRGVGRLRAAIALGWGSAVASVGAAALAGAAAGIDAMALAWLAVQLLGAAFAGWRLHRLRWKTPTS